MPGSPNAVPRRDDAIIHTVVKRSAELLGFHILTQSKVNSSEDFKKGNFTNPYTHCYNATLVYLPDIFFRET